MAARESLTTLEDSMVLDLELELSALRLSPAGLDEAARRGGIELELYSSEFNLVIGDVPIAVGQIIKKGGRNYLRVSRMLGAKKEES